MAKRKTSKARSNSAAKAGPMFDNPSKRVDSALRLWREGRYADALDLYREAIRLEPNTMRPYVMAARAYAEKFRFDRMGELYESLTNYLAFYNASGFGLSDASGGALRDSLGGLNAAPPGRLPHSMTKVWLIEP